MKSLLRTFKIRLLCVYGRLLARFGFISPPSSIVFVSEDADWAIKWVGNGLRSSLQHIHPYSFDISSSPHLATNTLVHFGSQYMWLDWGRHMSSTNRYVVSFFHGKHEDGPEVSRHISSFLRSESRLDAIIVSNSLVEDRLLGWGISRSKVIRIPIGVDCNLFTIPTSSDRVNSRRHYNIPSDAFVVGSFQKDGVGWGNGNIPKLIKGPDIFVDTLLRLRELGLPIFAFLTGPARGYVKERLMSEGIPFIHEYLSNRHDLVSCYHALDLYLVTSREEGGPMGLIEALASGLPVVSTPVGMAPDLIINGSNGYVSTTFSSNELSHLIVSIIKNTPPSDLSQCSRNSALTVDWSSVAAQHWSLVYKPLLIQ